MYHNTKLYATLLTWRTMMEDNRLPYVWAANHMRLEIGLIKETTQWATCTACSCDWHGRIRFCRRGKNEYAR